MVIQCCVCKQVRVNGKWRDIPIKRIEDLVSHGYCPHCAQAAFAEIQELRANAANKTTHSLSA